MSAQTLIERLKALTPAQFENVIYDLVSSAGLQNPVWRTPGSDGGRDIEGMLHTVDFSGFSHSTKWYIECKRYSSSVDWPTVWEKIAYADNHGADYLLMVTTSTLSPQCKSEVSSWNARGRKPLVRFWEHMQLERLLDLHSAVLVKHALVTDRRKIPASFMSLAQSTSRVVQAAYCSLDGVVTTSTALDAAASLAELLTARIKEAEASPPRALPGFVIEVDGFDWLRLVGDTGLLKHYDRHGLRAFLAFLRHSTGSKVISLEIAASELKMVSEVAPNATASAFLMELGFWSNIEVSLEGQSATLKQRKQ